MEVTNQNIGLKPVQPQVYNQAVPSTGVQSQQQVQPQPAAQTQPAQQKTATCTKQCSTPVPPQYNPQYCAPQYAQYPQSQPVTQNYQVPANASGVNIQIFNPSVSTPGAQPPTYNVNAPCYPSNYYTGQLGQNGLTNPYGYGQNGNNTNNGTQSGNVNNGTNNGTIGNNNNNTTNNTTNNTSTTAETQSSDNKKKTEKKKIVQLTDDYIRNLESYLNSQEKDVRLNAAKEVYARLAEDDSRKDDKALNALVNKMLQDPAEEIRLLALSALESRIVTGDDFTVGVLKQMQQSKEGYGQDAVDASKILLQMSGKQVEKEMPVKEKKSDKKDAKTETTTETKKEETKESSKA